MKCANKRCNKKNASLNIASDKAIVPIECDVGQLRKLFSFFEHRAPNIDSIHSPLLDYSKHENLLREMIPDNENYKFYTHNYSNSEMLNEQMLAGTELCDRCKRFACKRSNQHAKRDNTRKESDLECLLRHIRNAIAHGHVFIKHGGNYISICFEDLNKDKHITARILTNQAQLRRWKEKLEEAINMQ